MPAHRDHFGTTRLDDVNDPADIACLLARIPDGHVLVTSRLGQGWQQHGVCTVQLDVLAKVDAIDLLARVAPPPPRADLDAPELDGASELVTELGCLPLAIEQAAAFIAETGGTARDYLRLLAEYPADLYAHSPSGREDRGDRTVARVWGTTLNRLATDTPAAGEVLRVLAWFAPDHIPRTALEPLADQLGGPVTLHTAIGRLAAYNMITLNRHGDGGQRTITVHHLVQVFARTPDPNDPHRYAADIAAARDQAAACLERAFPESPRFGDRSTWISLIRHIDALIQNAPSKADTLSVASLLNTAGVFLFKEKDLWEARGYFRRSYETYLRILGADNRTTEVVYCNGIAAAAAYQDC